MEIQSEAAVLRARRVELQRLAARYVDELGKVPEVAAQPVRDKLAAIGQEQAGLEGRLAKLTAQARTQAAEEERQGAIRWFCETALRGLDALDAEGRRRLLGVLIDEIVVRPHELEIHGVLPGVDTVQSGETSRTVFEPRSYRLVIPVAGSA